MIERAGCTRLIRKAAEVIRVVRDVRQQDLDGDITIQTLILRAPHLPRTAGPETMKNGVGPNPFARLQSPAFGRHVLRETVKRRACQKVIRLPVGRQQAKRVTSHSDIVYPSDECGSGIDGQLDRTLRGDGLVAEFIGILDDYVARRYPTPVG